VDEIFVTRNYALTQYGAGGFNQDACVLKPTVAGQVNHFEVRLSATGIQIYGSDAGKTALKLLAHMTISVPLTRGLIWVEDVHYNANKFNTQGAHTFLWDNIGFDGPFLPRDLTFDVPEVKAVGSDGTMRLGWRAPYGGSTQALTASVASLSQATGAAVLFTWNAMDALVPSVRVNGGAWHDTPWPGGGQWSWKTIAVPVALSELRTGSNLLEFKTADSTNGAGVGLANVDILLIAAGGVPCFANPNQSCTGTPVPTAVPTATPTPTPTTFPLSAGQSLLISCPTTLTLVGNRLDCAQ
jgi:hypothetical protein